MEMIASQRRCDVCTLPTNNEELCDDCATCVNVPALLKALATTDQEAGGKRQFRPNRPIKTDISRAERQREYTARYLLKRKLAKLHTFTSVNVMLADRAAKARKGALSVP